MGIPINTLINKIEELGWSIDTCIGEIDGTGYFELSNTRPAGHDFSITVECNQDEYSLDEFMLQLFKAYLAYNNGSQFYSALPNLTIDMFGKIHHTPCMLEDVESCKSAILDIYNALDKLV